MFLKSRGDGRALAALAVGRAIAWFFSNVGRLPPHVPGATHDTTFAPPA